MKKPLDWKALGQFVAVLVQLYTIIADTFKERLVGLEIVEWLVGPGKVRFTTKLSALAREYHRSWFIKSPVPSNTRLCAEIDGSCDPCLVSSQDIIQTHISMGKLIIERVGDELWINHRRIILHRHMSQVVSDKGINGRSLHLHLQGKLVLNTCVLDYLYKHPEFFPESWMADEDGAGIFVCFWGTTFTDKETGDEFIRALCWDGVQLSRYRLSIQNDRFGPRERAAILEC